jgi:hypothetical protein
MRHCQRWSLPEREQLNGIHGTVGRKSWRVNGIEETHGSGRINAALSVSAIFRTPESARREIFEIALWSTQLGQTAVTSVIPANHSSVYLVCGSAASLYIF